MSISGEIENCEREIELLETQLAQVRSRLLALLVAQDNTRTIFKSSKEAKLHHTKCQEEIDNQALREMGTRERQAAIERAKVNNK